MGKHEQCHACRRSACKRSSTSNEGQGHLRVHDKVLPVNPVCLDILNLADTVVETTIGRKQYEGKCVDVDGDYAAYSFIFCKTFGDTTNVYLSVYTGNDCVPRNPGDPELGYSLASGGKCIPLIFSKGVRSARLYREKPPSGGI
jgi:hypothetical protein